MTVPTFLNQLSQLEVALNSYSLQELGVADASRLKDAFSAFKDRIEAKLWAKEGSDFLEELSPLATEVSTTEQLLHQAAEGKPKILLAEHDTRVAAFFIKHLHKAGYDVLWASHTAMAESLIQNTEPVLAICSVYSQSSFGSEVIKCIRQPEKKRIPVILVAGAEHSDALREAISLGADDYMAQHITASEIVGRIKQALN